MRVSYSRIKKYRQCHKLHDYAYNQKLRPRKKGRPLLAGSIGHDMLDADAKGDEVEEVLEKYQREYGTLFVEEQEIYGDLLTDITKVYEAYHRRYDEDGYYYVESEIEVVVPLVDDIEFICIIDKILEDQDNRLWLCDHKFSKNIPKPEQRASDLQLLGNAWAWDQKYPDRPLTGVLWDYIRSFPPNDPKVLKDGTLSKAVRQRTDRFTFEQAIEEKGLDKADYQSVLEALDARTTMYFERVSLPVDTDLQRSILDDYKATAIEINVVGDVLKDRNLTKDCSWCSYYKLCQAELRGHDAEFIRKRDYYVRDKNAETKEDNYEEDDTEAA